MHKLLDIGRREGEVIAIFGQARLVRKLDGAYELIGGSRENQDQAREWISLFFHEAVLARQDSRRLVTSESCGH